MSSIISLGAWCDLVPPDEFRGTPGSAGISVHEFAILADGRRVTIREDLGFTTRSHSYDSETSTTQQLDRWGSMIRESVERAVRTNVVIPDDDDTDEHPYEYLCGAVAQQGDRDDRGATANGSLHR